MKKLVLFAVAALALTFASCGGNNVANAEAEAKRIADSVAAEVAKLQEAAVAPVVDTTAAVIDSVAVEVKEVAKK